MGNDLAESLWFQYQCSPFCNPPTWLSEPAYNLYFKCKATGRTWVQTKRCPYLDIYIYIYIYIYLYLYIYIYIWCLDVFPAWGLLDEPSTRGEPPKFLSGSPLGGFRPDVARVFPVDAQASREPRKPETCPSLVGSLTPQSTGVYRVPNLLSTFNIELTSSVLFIWVVKPFDHTKPCLLLGSIFSILAYCGVVGTPHLAAIVFFFKFCSPNPTSTKTWSSQKRCPSEFLRGDFFSSARSRLRPGASSAGPPTRAPSATSPLRAPSTTATRKSEAKRIRRVFGTSRHGDHVKLVCPKLYGFWQPCFDTYFRLPSLVVSPMLAEQNRGPKRCSPFLSGSLQLRQQALLDHWDGGEQRRAHATGGSWRLEDTPRSTVLLCASI